ncbi:MAG: AbiTii domain-containing protein [Armatimonadota bacterium]
MSKLILELQQDAMENNSTVSELLRKALVVAKKLRIADFEIWVSHELNGYPTNTEIPEYREVVGSIKAWNPYHGWVPIIIEDSNVAELCSRRMIRQAVGSLEALLSGHESGSLQVPFSHDIEADLMRSMNIPLQPSLHVGSSQVNGILHSVRNTVLNWALDLESKGILGEDMSFTQEEKQAAREMQTVNIKNFQGVLGNVQNSTVTQNLNMSIHKGDFESLSAYLLSLGLGLPEIDDLKRRIDEEPVPEAKDRLGFKVSGWIGEMVAKAASGGWQIAFGTAGSLLAQAICIYYGFS